MEIKKPDFVILFAIIMAIIPFMFVWHTELIMYNFTYLNLTNGFVLFDGLQIYHVSMYIMFAFNIAGSYLILKKRMEDYSV